jgi:integrase
MSVETVVVNNSTAASASVSELHPILFLMGLFAGLGQTELSTVRREEIDLATATCKHRRNKTSQKGEYWRPAELVTRLKKYFRNHPVKPEDLAFRTRQGQPLVTEKSDAVRQAWDDSAGRMNNVPRTAPVGVASLTMSKMKKFFSTLLTTLG